MLLTFRRDCAVSVGQRHVQTCFERRQGTKRSLQYGKLRHVASTQWLKVIPEASQFQTVSQSSKWSNTKCVIVGAGISGLCAAITLAKQGFEVQIYETQDKAAIHSKSTCKTSMVTLDVAGLSYLESLGIDLQGDACNKTLSSATPSASSSFMTMVSQGTVVGPSLHATGPYYYCTRQTLCQLLLLVCLTDYRSQITIQYKCTVSGLNESEQRAVLSSPGGQVTSIPYYVLVGADGMDSVVRTNMERADSQLQTSIEPSPQQHITSLLDRELALESIGQSTTNETFEVIDGVVTEKHFPCILAASTIPSEVDGIVEPWQVQLQLYPERPGSDTICCSLCAPRYWWSEVVPACVQDYQMMDRCEMMVEILRTHFLGVPLAALEVIALEAMNYPDTKKGDARLLLSRAAAPRTVPGVAVVGDAAQSIMSAHLLPAQVVMLTARTLGEAFSGVDTTKEAPITAALAKYNSSLIAQSSALAEIDRAAQMRWSGLEFSGGVIGVLSTQLHNIRCATMWIANFYREKFSSATERNAGGYSVAPSESLISTPKAIMKERNKLRLSLLAAMVSMATIGAIILHLLF